MFFHPHRDEPEIRAATVKGRLRCKGRGNSVIINVITEMNYRCNYIGILKNISTM